MRRGAIAKVDCVVQGAAGGVKGVVPQPDRRDHVVAHSGSPGTLFDAGVIAHYLISLWFAASGLAVLVLGTNFLLRLADTVPLLAIRHLPRAAALAGAGWLPLVVVEIDHVDGLVHAFAL